MRPDRRLQAVATVVLVLSTLLLAWAAWSWWAPPAGSAPATPVVGAGASSTPGTAAAAPPGAGPTSAGELDPTGTWFLPPTEVRRLQIPSANYDSEVGTMAIADSGVINPPDFRRTWWIRDRGVAPSSQATDTTYLACHTDAAKATSAVPCNGVGSANVQVGGKVLVETDNEQLSYTITQARQVPRDEFARDTEVWDVNPGRLVWVSCYLSEGRRTDFNFVVIAELDR